MVGALAEVDVRTVGAILVAASLAAQDVDILVVVRAREAGRSDDDLPVPVPVARFRRPFAHKRQHNVRSMPC